MVLTHPIAGPDWGSIPEWVAAAVALAALFGAFWSLRYTAKSARTSAEANKITAAAYERDVQDRDEAQARLVHTTMPVPLFLGQGSIYEAPPGVAAASHDTPVELQSDSQVRVLVDSIALQATVHNRSAEIIGPIALSAISIETGEALTGRSIGTDDPILPGDSMTFEILVPHHDGYLRRGVRLEYRDSGGRWWARNGYEPIERIPDRPR